MAFPGAELSTRKCCVAIVLVEKEEKEKEEDQKVFYKVRRKERKGREKGDSGWITIYHRGFSGRWYTVPDDWMSGRVGKSTKEV